MDMFYKRSDALSHISCLLSISGLPPGWGELRGRGEEKGKGAGFFLEASWGLPCIIPMGGGVVGDKQFLPS